MKKFKFVHREFYEEFIDDYDDFTKVENPIGVSNLPTGEYMIRGNKKSHRKKYYHIGNEVWYLVEDVIRDNGHYSCDAREYQLFPQFSEKEWDKISSCYKYLTSLWKRNLDGYDFYMHIRELRRDVAKNFLKYD